MVDGHRFHDFVKVSVETRCSTVSTIVHFDEESTQGFRLVDRSARKDHEIFDRGEKN